jgi:hypothetical protein
MVLAGTLDDIYSSPPGEDVAQSMYEEVARVLGEEGGVWTKVGLSRMIRLESAVKETLRLRSNGATILSRKVNKKTSSLHPPTSDYHSLFHGG